MSCEWVEEITFAADSGTIYTRTDKGGKLWLGLAEGNRLYQGPYIMIQPTHRQLEQLRDEINHALRENSQSLYVTTGPTLDGKQLP